MVFEPNKEYVRDVLKRTVDWTGFDSEFVPVKDLPPGHRFFEYQDTVNAGGTPSEEVIRRHRAEFGKEYPVRNRRRTPDRSVARKRHGRG